MRYMILVQASPESEAGAMPPDAGMMAAMAAYHEALAQAGVLLDSSGLKPSSAGWRVQYDGGRRTVVDGPFAESKELIAGYTLIQVRSREEALEWSKRYPNPRGQDRPCAIEVRPVHELADLDASPAR